MADPAVSISVVIPVYNRERAVRRALLSVLAQTRPPKEIIVVDDASERPVAAAIADLRHARITIKVLRREQNGGASAARQDGIDAATGEAVAFLDSDDVWLPDKLERQLPSVTAAMRRQALTAVVCGWRSVPEYRGPARSFIPISSACIADFASGCWFCPGSTAVIPKSAFDVVGPFDGRLRRFEDLDWFLRFALAGGRVEVVEHVGAVISTGRRCRRATAAQSGRTILARFTQAPHPQLTPAVLRRLRAYVDLERSAAARNEGRYAEMAMLLALSMLRVPRTTISLRRWWRTTQTSAVTQHRDVLCSAGGPSE